MDRASSADLASSSSSSLFRRFQSKKSGSKTPTESLASSLPPPRHSHRRILSRDRKRPMVIYYSSNPLNLVNVLKLPASSDIVDEELSTPCGNKVTECDNNGFDSANELDLTSSMTPRENLASSYGPGRALMRMSQTFGRASERVETCSSGEGRAARQSVKYDVTWRQDDESACCQVCFAMFTKLSRRRHHCRVCGELVCGACSQDQVSLLDKFATPRRACVACCSLLQAMARARDDRVKIIESDATTATPMKRHKSVPVNSHSKSATPRYRDRLNEVHRVMAAGKLSRHRGSSEKKLYVISSRWVRSWLAFTSSASRRPNSMCSPDYGFDTETSPSSPHSDKSNINCAPGPIDNLSLLELSRGKLIRRLGLTRDATFASDVSNVSEDGDFQLLSPEVWDVFQRLYGGAPAIFVDLTSSDPSAWIVDVASLLTHTNEQLAPTIERALLTRHCSDNSLYDSRTPTPVTPGSSRYFTQQSPKSPAWTVTSSICSSVGEDKERMQSPVGSAKVRIEDLETDLATLTLKTSVEGEEEMRATSSGRSPTAAPLMTVPRVLLLLDLCLTCMLG
ncbi:FYVE finger containing protein [Plasmopara halstedii]|uniref:FYVE finger containing protein n=1 Tax=Plasmopara halstedii TaxID=4781 RepID=A0A0P1ACT5_PLAHL|nr:FYVE finger containing protein [Plasmopara halstedii]CEG38514.1 FYVE finger containing protein [Plasmopara halstedii]|eukprot:XP_024574883.1 FYVE finger containing protein [Plasmopara halstedii]